LQNSAAGHLISAAVDFLRAKAATAFSAS